MEKYLQGYVKVILYQNKDNGYSVIKVKVTENTEEINDISDLMTVTGYLPTLRTNELYRFFGDFKEHYKYGNQYNVNKYENIIADSREGLIRYLSSDIFFGVGPKLASKIVDKIGENCIEVIIDNPEKLKEIGINDRKINAIHQALMQNQGIQRVLLSLYDYGFSARVSMAIYNTYYNQSLSILESNPYQLIEDIDSINFKRADEIAMKLDFTLDNEFRVKALVLAIMSKESMSGDTFIENSVLIERVLKDVNRNEYLIDDKKVQKHIDILREEEKIYIIENKIMLQELYEAEESIASDIIRFNPNKPKDNKIDTIIESVSQNIDIDYSLEQKEAIKTALMNPVTVLTGGPGTGKTTVINGIIKSYEKLFEVYDRRKIALVAPTGRAAKRMTETTGYTAKTIHSFLGYDFNGIFTHNREDQLSPKLLIIDESSMIDTLLTKQLLEALVNSVRIVIVGDNDQLPSVGPGQVLHDIIESGIVPVIRLNKIFRQSSDSNLITLAHEVNNNRLPNDTLNSYDDVTYIHTINEISSAIKQIIEKAVERDYEIENIQVLAPMYKGSAGIDKINIVLQECLNPKGPNEIEHHGVIYRVGDKVLQLVNQPREGIMNGDVGIVCDISKSNSTTKISVDFDGIIAEYGLSDLYNLRHAYCISIHKSQGNEYPLVILPMSFSYRIMLKRKLIYTAITRAKQKLIVVGDLKAMKFGVEQIEKSRRTLLKKRFEEIKNRKNYSTL
ncbi:ATP-dependent RecD-like DNA helicase [Mycoplasmatota bacterium]|nr:ATP-dependent RecD-like DNA helicase [Mycoplasmatota bacterium]